MGHFIGQTAIYGKDYFKLLLNLEYIPSSEFASFFIELPLVVPKWFKSDFSSFPLFLTLFFSLLHKSAKAVIIHDWLYFDSRTTKKYIKIDRKQADLIFKDCLIACKVNFLKIWVLYISVRIFCGRRWECGWKTYE